MLLQVPEQREAAENEIRTHHVVNHDNVVQLVDSEIKDNRNGEGTALLVFPYYQVCRDIEKMNTFHRLLVFVRMGHCKT